MKNKVALLATVPVVAAISIGAFATIQAQEDTNVDVQTNREQKMVELTQRIADNLEVEYSDLVEARKDAATSLIDEKVAAGELDSDRAEEMKAKIEESETGMPHMSGQRRGHGHSPEKLADKLGLTADELKAELDSGKTIEQIAEENGVEFPEKSERFGGFRARINQ